MEIETDTDPKSTELKNHDNDVDVDADPESPQVPSKRVRLEMEIMAKGTGADTEAESQPSASQELTSIPPTPTNPTLAYTTGPHFTSEPFKIEILNLPIKFGFSHLKKFIERQHKLKTRKIKLIPFPGTKPGSFVFVTFSNEEERAKAIKVLDGSIYRGRPLRVKAANAIEDPLLKVKIQKEKEADVKLQDEPENETEPKQSAEELVLNATTPLHNLSYADQLIQKKSMIVDVVRKMTKELVFINPKLKDFCQTSSDVPPKESGTKLICDVDPILPSPRINGYRNKCEFSIGYNPDTREKTVGFRISSYKKGSVSVGPVDKFSHILPEIAVESVNSFQEFIRSSKYEPFDPSNFTGVWKQLTVRTTEDRQIMLYLILSSMNLTTDEVAKIKIDLKSHYASKENLSITSFYFKEAETHGTSQKNEPDLLFGKDVITESLLGFNYQISPDAFFQINFKGAELLYKTLAQVAELDEKTTLIDVCCGTGAIGFSCLKTSNLGEVLGIELVPTAIVDAKTSADLNHVADKCQFYCGKAEALLGLVIQKAKYEKIVIVVDPPRAGLHPNVVKTLRSTANIHKLVYVACDANAAMSNFLDFARPASKKFKGSPFIPKRMIPVDMFPHTKHYELIVLMERVGV